MDLETTLGELAPRLLRYCRGRSASPELAEESAQEALTALVARWRRHGPPESPEAFAFVIARRRLSRQILRQRWLEPLERVMHGHSPRPDPESTLLARSDLERTLGALDRLPQRLRDAMLLVAAGELDTETAAGVLGISKSALKMRVHRARQQLGHLLEERS
ncbi:MAG: RNA polymerase sigma factor [Acidobacteriota bacterium]